MQKAQKDSLEEDGVREQIKRPENVIQSSNVKYSHGVGLKGELMERLLRNLETAGWGN